MEWQNKHKPTDRTLEPRVLETIPDATLFRRMQEVESDLDALVQRKRLDLQDMIGRSMRKNETLRIFISSSVANQAWQEGTELYQDPANPNWTLRIEGRLVHDNSETPRAFSSMITSVIVELNKVKSEEEHSTEMDGVEVSQAGETTTTAPAPESSNTGDETNDITANGNSGDPTSTAPAAPTNTAAPEPSKQANPENESTDASGAPAPVLGTSVNPENELSTNDPLPSSVSPGSHASVQADTTSKTSEEVKVDTETKPDSQSEPQSDEVVEWHEACVPPEQRVDFDGLDVKRPGNEPVTARVLIQLKEYPDKFKLSPQLAEVLGVAEESKPGAVVSLWQYIRYHNLQDVDEKRLIKCNAPLYHLFKREKIMLPQLVELLAPHLSPREPIVIEYTVDPTKAIENRDLAFDVPIQVDHPLRSDLLAMLSLWHHDNGSISKIEDLLVQDVQALNLLAHRHKFYEDFSNEPVDFLQRLVASQARDLKIIYCDRQFSEEAVRHSSFYSDDILNPSLHLFLSKQ